MFAIYIHKVATQSQMHDYRSITFYKKDFRKNSKKDEIPKFLNCSKLFSKLNK